jgi:hypothetical protein
MMNRSSLPTRSRRFRPTFDALPLRLAPSVSSPIEPTLVGWTPPDKATTVDTTPIDPTVVGCSTTS